MFLTKFRPANSLDTWFDRDYLPSLRRWFEVDGKDNEVFRLPMTNIHETDKEFVLTLEMPGVDKKDIKVGVENDRLVVGGERSEKTESEGLIRREIRSAKFHRSFTLNPTIDRDGIKAKMENGILKVTLPKLAESVGREVAID